MKLKKEEIEASIQRKNELNLFLDKNDIMLKDFAKQCNLQPQNLSKYRNGDMRITASMWVIIQETMKKFEANSVSDCVVYQKMLDDFINRYKVPTSKLAQYSDLSDEAIRNYLSGSWSITDRKWIYIKQAMKRIKEEKAKVDRSKKPNLVMNYMVNNLKEHHNTIVMKKHCAHREDELLQQLVEAGCDCNMINTDSDHYVLELKGRWNK